MCKRLAIVLSYELDESKCPRITWSTSRRKVHVQRLVLVSANPIPPIPLPCARRSSAPGHVQVHAPPQQGMFQKQFLAVSSPPSAVAATANQHPQPLQSSLLSVTRPAPGWGSRLTPCQSKPPNPETSLGSAQAHYYLDPFPLAINMDFELSSEFLRIQAIPHFTIFVIL